MFVPLGESPLYLSVNSHKHGIVNSIDESNTGVTYLIKRFFLLLFELSELLMRTGWHTALYLDSVNKTVIPMDDIRKHLDPG